MLSPTSIREQCVDCVVDLPHTRVILVQNAHVYVQLRKRLLGHSDVSVYGYTVACAIEYRWLKMYVFDAAHLVPGELVQRLEAPLDGREACVQMRLGVVPSKAPLFPPLPELLSSDRAREIHESETLVTLALQAER